MEQDKHLFDSELDYEERIMRRLSENVEHRKNYYFEDRAHHHTKDLFGLISAE